MSISFIELPNFTENIIIVNTSEIKDDDPEINLPIASEINPPIEVFPIKYERKINCKLVFLSFYTVLSIMSLILGVILILNYKINYGYILFIYGLFSLIILFFCMQL
jgi:hypothetical protein